MTSDVELGPVPEPPEILVVASWYPGVEDLAAGRFVADQVVALAAAKQVVPLVVSFDRLPLIGGGTARGRQVEPVHSALAEAVASEQPLFHATALGVDAPVRIARLAIADGTTPALGTTSAELHRVSALQALADRMAADGSPRPALVHAHTGYPDGAAAAELADRLGCPLVITEHATFLARILNEPGQRQRYSRACARASRVIAVSQVLADQIRSALPEVADRLVIVPNAVAVDEFHAPALDQRVQDELLFVGYRKEIKGIDTLLEAFAVVAAKRPAARLRLIGGSPTADLDLRWKALAARLDIADRVSFEGGMSRAEIADAMARASVFVHASRYETFGVVAAEALASGLPVVATDSGGVTEILGAEPGRLGALVAVDDSRALGHGILETLDRRETFDAATLRASVRSRFGAEVVAERLRTLYAEILSESAGLPAPPGVPTPPTAPDATVRIVIVGLDRRSAAERLARLPAGLAASVALVTSGEPRSVVLPPLGWVGDANLPALPAGRATPGSRIRRFLSSPVQVWRARAERAGLTDAGVTSAAREVERILAEIRSGSAADAPPLEIVALDGRDIEALRRIEPDPSWRISAGGLGRLGDRWASGGGPS